jgi:hypothetical protein
MSGFLFREPESSLPWAGVDGPPASPVPPVVGVCAEAGGFVLDVFTPLEEGAP